MRGCWISSEHIDISALILDNFTKRQRQLNKRSDYWKAKANDLAALKENKQSNSRAIVGEEPCFREVAALRQTRQEKGARPKAPQAEVSQRKVASAAPNQGKQNVCSNIQIPSHHDLTIEARRWTEISCAILQQHQTDLLALAKSCLHSNVALPEYRREEMRNATLMNLKGIGFLQVPDEKLIELMLSSEEEALRGINFSNEQHSTQPSLANKDHLPGYHDGTHSASNGWGASIGWSQIGGFGDGRGSQFDPPAPAQQVVASNFRNSGGSHSTRSTSWPAEIASAASPSNDLLSALGGTLMRGNMGPMPEQGYMTGVSHHQHGFQPSMGRSGAPPYPHQSQPNHQYAPQHQPFLFEHQIQHHRSSQHQQQHHQPQFNQFGVDPRGPHQIESFLRSAEGQVWQPFLGQNQQLPGAGQHEWHLQQFLLQQQQQQQQRQNSQFRGPPHPGNDSFW